MKGYLPYGKLGETRMFDVKKSECHFGYLEQNGHTLDSPTHLRHSMKWYMRQQQFSVLLKWVDLSCTHTN